MLETDVIIVGGGPGGSACAWRLMRHGINCIILDKAEFPRFKPCAGWITPQVLKDLQLSAENYSYGLTHFSYFAIEIKQFAFSLRTNQYAIRRVEFDDWLLKRTGAEVHEHKVESIAYKQERYIVDGQYAAKYLVGAGGTHCPVNKMFFQSGSTREQGTLIVAMEEEFRIDGADKTCRLWFLQDGLPGYAWYVPKENGFVNVGVGGSSNGLKKNQDTLKRHWNLLVQKLEVQGLVQGHTYKPSGHSYYLRGKHSVVRLENAFLVGDAIGLATLDMGEGISAAIQSGLRAADAIAGGGHYSIESIARYSFPSLLGWRR